MEEISEYIPTQGMLIQQETPTFILCKPKLMPLKSVTLEKLEKMQKEAEEKAKQQMKEDAYELQGDRGFSHGAV